MGNLSRTDVWRAQTFPVLQVHPSVDDKAYPRLLIMIPRSLRHQQLSSCYSSRFGVRLAQALPDAKEIMHYGMPEFGSAGLVIAGYAAFSKQCGHYVSTGEISAHSHGIPAAGLKASKTGVTSSPVETAV